MQDSPCAYLDSRLQPATLCINSCEGWGKVAGAYLTMSDDVTVCADEPDLKQQVTDQAVYNASGVTTTVTTAVLKLNEADEDESDASEVADPEASAQQSSSSDVAAQDGEEAATFPAEVRWCCNYNADCAVSSRAGMLCIVSIAGLRKLAPWS
jgi:hypothetical protein